MNKENLNSQSPTSKNREFHTNSTSSSLIDKMRISHPDSAHFPRLRKLWKNTFGDSDAFIDIFFKTAFSPKRSFCATIHDTVVGVLYWFDCECEKQKIAYIYAVATAKEVRGQGICHKLMAHTHQNLKEQGYAGAILSPAEESLFGFYGKMGYKTCAYMKELHYTNTSYKVLSNCKNSICFENTAILIQQISKTEFAKLRRRFLPSDAIVQENENLDFLEKEASFFAGENFLLTAQIIEIYDENNADILIEKQLRGIEFLGDASKIPYILTALECASGDFRTIGTQKAVGMYHSFTDTKLMPTYIGFIFD